jgi:serine/threonine protein kinase
VIGQTISHYRIVARIGAGGMGEVWQAHDPRLDREVAIKTLPLAAARDAGRIARFEREARATGALNHPNILAIYDVGQHEGVPYIVSELLRGSSLRQRLREADLTPRRAVEVAIQIADGWRSHWHRPRDPAGKRLITQDGPVKILDFGLAKLHQPDPTGSGAGTATLTVETEDGAVVGTLGYMSPEQLSGKPADHRSDIFAFGAMLFEMLAGKRAFGGDSRANMVAAILRDDPPAFAALQRTVPAPLEQLVRRCLEKRPEDRYQSVHDLALALRAIDNTSDWSAARPRPARAGRVDWLAARRHAPGHGCSHRRVGVAQGVGAVACGGGRDPVYGPRAPAAKARRRAAVRGH